MAKTDVGLTSYGFAEEVIEVLQESSFTPVMKEKLLNLTVEAFELGFIQGAMPYMEGDQSDVSDAKLARFKRNLADY